MKKRLFYSFALLLVLSLFVCNNNETSTKDISQVKENPSVAKAGDYAEIGSRDNHYSPLCNTK
jgi:hypothetical protein